MNELLSFFYFLYSIIILINEINWIINFEKQQRISDEIIQLLKNEEPIPKEYKYRQFQSLFIVIWALIGLFTYQWLLFLVLIVSIYFINKLNRYINNNIYFIRITRFLILFSSLLFIISYYQLHLYNDLEVIKNLF